MKRWSVGVMLAAGFLAGCGPANMARDDPAVGEFQVGHIRQAKEMFRQALDRNPSDPLPLYYMGRIACTESEWEDAIYYLQCCLDADPRYTDARRWLARAQHAAGSAGRKLRFIPYWPGHPPGREVD